MSMVVDASAVLALLLDDGPTGRWVGQTCAGQHLVAPHLLPVEVVNVLRRRVLAGALSADAAALAHADLLALPVGLVPYDPCAARVWELRANLSAYDGWYVATAEAFDAPLTTLDLRLANAPGSRCTFLTSP